MVVAERLWQRLDRFRKIDAKTFGQANWQKKHTIKSTEHMEQFLREVSGEELARDFRLTASRNPMEIRVTPYILSLIDWEERKVWKDPLRKQFIPLYSECISDHLLARFDSLGELEGRGKVTGATTTADEEMVKNACQRGNNSKLDNDGFSTGTLPSCIVHRYPNKVLFLASSVCPVYCRFCTRSYAIGGNTPVVKKKKITAMVPKLWKQGFEYIRQNSGIKDVVVSGGDVFQLTPSMLFFIGENLLNIHHVRRLRFATKGLSVLPMKITSDHLWMESFGKIVCKAQKLGKHVCVHTHINHANEISSDFTYRAMEMIQDLGVVVRNQTVLLNGVNDHPNRMLDLQESLGEIGIEPYYVYLGDMIPGSENLRTSLQKLLLLEKETRGATAGFLTPQYVTDLPHGGGKRLAHSYEFYDRKTGISVYSSPKVCREKFFIYCDPIHTLQCEDAQRAWQHHCPQSQNRMLENARAAAAAAAAAASEFHQI